MWSYDLSNTENKFWKVLMSCTIDFYAMIIDIIAISSKINYHDSIS